MRKVPTAATMMLAASTLAFGQGLVQKATNPIQGQYIVVFDDEALQLAVPQGGKPADVRQVADSVAAERRLELRGTFQHALKGFVARMTAAQAESLAGEPWVRSIEQDGRVDVTSVQDAPPSWGLDRIDQHGMLLDGEYHYSTAGAGVDIYIVDSGIRATHADFGGRVDTVNAFTAVDDGFGTDDRFGHGTMVAGVVAGATFGVAKAATLHPVRVIDSTGNGTISGLIDGIDWITSQFTSQTARPRRPAVVNISLITGGSPAINYAVNNSITAGVTYVVAAGNTGDDSCGYSPAGVVAAITVGASNDADNVWSGSNSGTCVDVFAPGVSINTTFVRSDTDTVTTTGTSVAAPHVAGAAALFLAANPTATPAQVGDAIIAASTPDALAAMPLYTPNRLLYNTFAIQDRPPVASFTVSCKARTCTFDASASSDDKGIASYSWSFGDGATGTGVTVTHRYASLDVAQSATLSVSDTTGHVATLTQTISSLDLPPVASFSVSCSSNTCSFDASASTDDKRIASYSWMFGDGTTANGARPKHSYPSFNSTFSVTLTVKDSAGQAASFTQLVSVKDTPPVASFRVSCSARTCSFDATSSSDDKRITSYSWQFGDGASDSGAKSKHRYLSGAGFTASLSVTDTAGQVTTLSHLVSF
jgi:serine protease